MTEADPGLIGRPLELAALIDHQAGAVVSRTLIKKATGTVTLFAFDRGQELSEHTSPYDALVCVLEGEMTITISGEPLSLHGGEMLIMPAGKPHAVKAVQPAKLLLVMIREP